MQMNDYFLRLIIAPYVAEKGNLDGSIKKIERYAAQELSHRGLSPVEIGAHLGRSRTWVYDCLKTPDFRTNDTNLQANIMTFLATQFPEGRTFREITDAISGPNKNVLNALEALRKIGQIDFDQSRYRARDSDLIGSGVLTKKEKVAQGAKLAYDIGTRYLKGDSVIFARTQYVLDRDVWRDTVLRIRDAITKLLQEAKKESYNRHPDGLGPSVEIKGVIAIGPEDENST